MAWSAYSSRFGRALRARRGRYEAFVKVTADGAHVSGTSASVSIR